MTQTNYAYVAIERLKVTKTQEGKMTGLPKEPGKTHEWRMTIKVNGQIQWWGSDDIKTGGDYKVNCVFPFVPLIDGKLTIAITGEEQDLLADTTLSGRSLTLTPAVDCPYGVHHIWVTSYSSGYYGTPPFVAEESYGTEGGFDFRISIHPLGKSVENAPHDYAVLIHDRDVDQGYWVSGMESFTKTIDEWRGAGLRLSRIATCETNPGQPSFSDVVERTYIGVFEAGRTDMPFWELGLDDFKAKIEEHWKVDKIRPTDIYAYFDKGWTMVGGTFDKGNRTELVALPRAEFEREAAARGEAGQGLIAIDSYSDGRRRWFVGLFEHGIGKSMPALALTEREFRSQDHDLNNASWRVTDFCTYNDGGTQIFNAVWRKGDYQTWLTLEPDWSHLASRVSYNWGRHRQVVGIDSWSAAAAD
jgi:hypothetical protein